MSAARALGADLVRWNRFGAPQSLSRSAGHLSPPRAGAKVDVAREFLLANAALFRLSEAEVAALKVINDAPLLEGPQLRAAREGGAVFAAAAPHAVLFGQVFDGIEASQDGLVAVGVTADGAVTYVSSSLTGETAVSGARTLDARGAYLAAAGSVGQRVDAGAVSVSPKSYNGFTQLRVTGRDQSQFARPAVVPTATGVRRAWEVNVVDTQSTDGAEPTYYTVFVDGETGASLVRSNRIFHLAEGLPGVSTAATAAPAAAAAPSGGSGRVRWSV